jgi:type 1 glutamine amidotransferase
VEILFLGDNGHHRPVERVPALMAALGDKGINLTYTDRLDDLNPATLARYDGLLVYANWDSMPAPQEKALLDYVASGKGLIPVHCASYCFRNSAEYVKLVGGQFWRHKMDTVRATVTDAAHPAVAGLQPFGAYDETYLHEKLGADNHVLMTREIKADQAADKPNQKTEPYTWTRTHGAGRVFYTAYGHDERTWEQPGFHALLERGILWAVGDRVRRCTTPSDPNPSPTRRRTCPTTKSGPARSCSKSPFPLLSPRSTSRCRPAFRWKPSPTNPTWCTPLP